jgi:shikimate kinase
VVWLRASLETLVRRLGDRPRPELGSDPRSVLVRLSAERAELFEQVAHVVLDVDGLTPPQAARALVETLPS